MAPCMHTWSPMGNGDLGFSASVESLIALPDDSVIVVGNFPGPGGFNPGRNITRWRANTWTPFGAGLDFRATTAAQASDGTVFAGWLFAAANGQPSAYFARLTTTCQALSQPSGTACPTPAGTTTLATASLPWLGGVFRAFANGVPANALVVAVTGFSPITVQLSSLLPQGVPVARC